MDCSGYWEYGKKPEGLTLACIGIHGLIVGQGYSSDPEAFRGLYHLTVIVTENQQMIITIFHL